MNNDMQQRFDKLVQQNLDENKPLAEDTAPEPTQTASNQDALENQQEYPSQSSKKSTRKTAAKAKSDKPTVERFSVQVSNKTKLFAYLEEYMENAPPIVSSQNISTLLRLYMKDREDELIEALKRFANGK